MSQTRTRFLCQFDFLGWDTSNNSLVSISQLYTIFCLYLSTYRFVCGLSLCSVFCNFSSVFGFISTLFSSHSSNYFTTLSNCNFSVCHAITISLCKYLFKLITFEEFSLFFFLPLMGTAYAGYPFGVLGHSHGKLGNLPHKIELFGYCFPLHVETSRINLYPSSASTTTSKVFISLLHEK